MPEHIKYEDDDLFNPETHHESSDVPVSPLLWFIVIFIVLGVVTHFLILFMYKGMVGAERRRMDPPQTQVARPTDASVPKNQPLLQPFPRQDAHQRPVPPNRVTPVTDMIDMHRAEDRVLHNYGWVDKEKGVVHIPIAEAKKLYVARLAVSGATGSQPVTTTTTTAPPATTTGGTQ